MFKIYKSYIFSNMLNRSFSVLDNTTQIKHTRKLSLISGKISCVCTYKHIYREAHRIGTKHPLSGRIALTHF